jgi:hypothetical protein
VSTYYEVFPGGAVADSLSEAKERAAAYTRETGEDTFVNLVTSVSLFRCTNYDDPHERPAFEELSLLASEVE